MKGERWTTRPLLSYPAMACMVVSVAFAAAASQQGVAAATKSAFSFNPGLALLDSSGAATGAAEPTIKVDSAGHIYVTGPAGVPTGGCPWWSVHPDSLGSNGLPYDYLGTFDSFPSGTPIGGGDCDIATGGLPPQNGYDNLALSSLSAADITVNESPDGGKTLKTTPNPFGSLVPGDDRQWNAADTGIGQVYMVVHDLATDNIQFGSSIDGGYTYTRPAVGGQAIDFTQVPGALTNNYFGEPVVDPRTHLIYVPFLAGATAEDAANGVIDAVYLAVGNPCAISCAAGSPIADVKWTDYTVYGPQQGASFGYIFPSAAIDAAGNVYVSWSDDSHVWITHSSMPAAGGPWTAPVEMDGGLNSHSNVMQWIVGGAAGIVDAVWYSAQLTGSGTTCPSGTTGTPNDSNGVNNNCFDSWNVEFAQSRDQGTTFSYSQVVAQNHVGSLCTQGLNCNLNGGNRNLLDFFQVALDPAGAANIAFADDLSGTVNIEYTRQCSGLSATSGQSIHYSCKAFYPPPPAPAPVCGNSKDGYLATVATDPSGDAINPSGAGGDTSDVDITGVTMQTSGADLITTLSIANLSADPPTPIAGTTDTYYYVAWQTAGTWWATLATEPQPDSLAFSYGNFDPSTNQLTTVNSTTGTIITGSPGEISIAVPLSALDNPLIPVKKPDAAMAAVQDPFGSVTSGEGVLGTGLVFVHPDDRAPDQGYGSSWSVC
jgi:hypothetical protein